MHTGPAAQLLCTGVPGERESYCNSGMLVASGRREPIPDARKHDGTMCMDMAAERTLGSGVSAMGENEPPWRDQPSRSVTAARHGFRCENPARLPGHLAVQRT